MRRPEKRRPSRVGNSRRYFFPTDPSQQPSARIDTCPFYRRSSSVEAQPQADCRVHMTVLTFKGNPMSRSFSEIVAQRAGSRSVSRSSDGRRTCRCWQWMAALPVSKKQTVYSLFHLLLTFPPQRACRYLATPRLLEYHVLYGSSYELEAPNST